MSRPRPTFLDGYLVAGVQPAAAPVGAVRRTGHVWRMFLFGVSPQDQPTEVFATREAAGVQLLALAEELNSSRK